MWDQNDVAVVQRVGYPVANLSHFESQDIYSYGVRNGFGGLGISPSGWMARFADLYAPTPLGAVALGVGRPTSFVGGSSNPLQVGSLAGFRFNSDSGSTGIVNNDALRKNVIKQVLAGAVGGRHPGGRAGRHRPGAPALEPDPDRGLGLLVGGDLLRPLDLAAPARRRHPDPGRLRDAALLHRPREATTRTAIRATRPGPRPGSSRISTMRSVRSRPT